jgi:hypothetical protein
MNSERGTRKKHAARLDEQIASLEAMHETSGRDLQALKLAREILSEVPVKQTECSYELQRFTISGVMEQGRCSECLEDSIGWSPRWKHCPLCGSTIVEAKKENDPIARLQHDAVKQAVNQLTGVR